MSQQYNSTETHLVEAFSKRAAKNLALLREAKKLGSGAFSTAYKFGDIALLTPKSGFYEDEIYTAHRPDDKEVAKNILFNQSFRYKSRDMKVKTSALGEDNLLEYLKKNKLPYDVVMNIALQVLIGLNELHRAGKVHLDLKLENIIVLRSTPCIIQIIDSPDIALIDNTVPLSQTIVISGFAVPDTLFLNKDLSEPQGKYKINNIKMHEIHNNPIKYDMHTYAVFLTDLFDRASLLIPNDLDFREMLNALDYSSENSNLDVILNSKIWGIRPEDRALNRLILIKQYEKTLQESEKGYYETRNLNNPLQTAPWEIRNLILAYKSLRAKEMTLLDTNFNINDFASTIKHIKNSYEAFSNARWDAMQHSSYMAEIKGLVNNISYSKDLEDFVTTAAEFSKNIMGCDNAINNLNLKASMNKIEPSDFKKNKNDFEQKRADLQVKLKEFIKESRDLSVNNPFKQRCLNILQSISNRPFVPLAPLLPKRSEGSTYFSFFAPPGDLGSEKVMALNEKEFKIVSKKGLVGML